MWRGNQWTTKKLVAVSIEPTGGKQAAPTKSQQTNKQTNERGAAPTSSDVARTIWCRDIASVLSDRFSPTRFLAECRSTGLQEGLADLDMPLPARISELDLARSKLRALGGSANELGRLEEPPAKVRLCSNEGDVPPLLGDGLASLSLSLSLSLLVPVPLSLSLLSLSHPGDPRVEPVRLRLLLPRPRALPLPLPLPLALALPLPPLCVFPCSGGVAPYPRLL